MASSQSEGGGQQVTGYRLIEERNLAFRDVEPEGSPVDTFLKVWPRLEPHYGNMVERLKSALEKALSIRCTVSARVKSLSSIKKSIERREIHREKQYKDVDEIFDDLHDLAGFRIVVDYPSGIQTAKAFITQSFQLKSTNVFKADREVPNAWKPTFGSFQSENHRVVLHSDAKYPLSPFCDILFEIQILSLAESLYNRLAHPLLYKKSSGQLSIKEEKMIDVTHGLSLCYWICLSCMEDRLERKELQEIPIPVRTVAQLDENQNADIESVVKVTPYSMPAPGETVSIEKCLETVKDLSKEAMSTEQLHSRLSVLSNGSTQTSTTNASYGSGDIMQNYGSGSNNAYNAGGDITIGKEDIEDEIRNAFWVTDSETHKEDIQERKGGLIEGSYRWILHDEHFEQWYDQQYSLLWLNGDPGKGKTMSVCGIIDHINVRTSEDSNTLLSYFFCDASDSNLNNATSVLRGIVYSIIFQNKMALSYVRERFKELSKPLADPRLAWPVLQKIFIGISGTMKNQNIYLIIDALDECREGRDKLLEFVVKQSSTLSAKWLLSSRKWPAIKEILTTCPKLLELNLEDNETDVSAAVGLYISHQVETLSKIKRYDQRRKKTVEDHLRSNSKNTFLWVSLVCQMLKRIPAWRTDKRLDDSPAGLDALYGRMLEQIQPSSQDLGFDELYPQIISFTLGAFRPLSLDELYSLVDDEDIAFRDLEQIVALCGSFLTIQRRVVYFIHPSAKDYLSNDACSFRFNPKQQHAVLFSKSLTNMTRSLHRDILHLDSHDTRTAQESLSSISYQCVHWIAHLMESGPSKVKQELLDGSLLDTFLRQRFLFWLEALGHLKSIGLGITGMLKLERMVQNHTSELKDLVQDEVRFIRSHQFGIQQSPLQVYLLLNFTPYKSITRMIYESEAPRWFTLQHGVPDHWSPCILTLEGHTDFVRSVAFSYDGCLLVSGSDDRAAKIWDVSTGVCLHTFLGHTYDVRTVAFSPKNYNVATGSGDKTIKIWDAKKGVLIRTLDCQNGPICALAFSRDGKLVASGAEDGTIKLLDTVSSECTRQLTIDNGDNKAQSLAFTHDDQILSCGTHNSVLIWDLKDKTEPHRIPMHAALFGHKIAVSSQTNDLFLIRDYDIEVWNPATRMCIRTIKYPPPPLIYGPSEGRSVILSRHGTILGVNVDGKVDIVDPLTLERIVQMREKTFANSVSPTSDILAIASHGKDRITIWDLASIAHLNYSSPAADHIPVFSRDGSLIATGLETEVERIVTVRRSCTGESIALASGHWPTDHKPKFSFDGQMLLLQNSEGIHITHVFKKGVGFKLSLTHSNKGEPTLSHDNRWLVVSCRTHVSIFEFGAPFAEIKVDADDNWNLAAECSFSHDSKTLAVHHGQYTNLYDINTWRCKSALRNVKREGRKFWKVFFSSDDKLLATRSHEGGEFELNIWNLATNVCSRILYTESFYKPKELTLLQLETVLGDFKITDGRIQPFVPLEYKTSQDMQWILKGSERLVWLPPDYRPWLPWFVAYQFCRACSKFKVAFATDSCRLVILTLP